jgi:hypothetical protein
VAQRSVHYEAAFEDYLRSRGLPYVAVDEAKKAVFGRISLKSFDFIVYSEQGPNLLVDVKGRKFPDSTPGRKRGGKAWENWITRDDVEGLAEWQGVFGGGFQAALVFAYWLQGPPQRSPFTDVHFYRENHYAFVAMDLEQYVAMASPRSQKWQTLAVGALEFSAAATDIASLL